MAKLISSAPTFLVNDVAATAQWYEQKLGFTANVFPKVPPCVYASLQRDGVEIMLLSQEGYCKPEVTRPGGVWDAYIRMRGLVGFCNDVRAKIPLKGDLTKRPYGDTEFEVMDPNGYVLVFGKII
jgi:catechol 2,3-dioxygenase-like lactoylglutathione lyase family enzyme